MGTKRKAGAIPTLESNISIPPQNRLIFSLHLIVQLGTLAVVWILFIMIIIQLPETVPLHFDLSGIVDRYGSPWTLLFLPIFLTAFMLLFLLLSMLDLDNAQILRASLMFGTILLLVLACLFLGIFFGIY